MSFANELHIAHLRFLAMIREDGHADILQMPYAEFTLQCYTIYKDMLYGDILKQNGVLAQAFQAISVKESRDHLLIFLDTLYLSLHMEDKQLH